MLLFGNNCSNMTCRCSEMTCTCWEFELCVFKDETPLFDHDVFLLEHDVPVFQTIVCLIEDYIYNNKSKRVAQQEHDQIASPTLF